MHGSAVYTRVIKVASSPPETGSPLSRALRLRFPEPFSDDTLLWLSEHNPTLGFEQNAEGALIVSPPASSLGNRGELELTTQLVVWNKAARFGEVRGISGGVRLPEGGQYEPDAFVVSAPAWSALDVRDRSKGFVPVLPLAIFELLSPAKLLAKGFSEEFAEKLGSYARSRVPLVVLLHPRNETATIRRPGSTDVETAEPVLAFPELPGLRLDVAAVYAACNEP
jgi:Uma2 family endonuclease